MDTGIETLEFAAVAPARPLALIIDDSRTGRRIVTTLLGFFGFEVIEASNIAEALARVAEHRFALFTVDRNLGDEDGVELVRLLRADANCGEIPKILALTGNVGKAHSDAFFNAGADAYLTKPFTAQQLGEILAALGFDRHQDKAREPQRAA